MASQVYAISLRTHHRESMSQKLLRLFNMLKPEGFIKEKSRWAIKIHFGERGCDAFIRPHFARVFVEAIKARKASVFLTDTTTLYVGYRANAIDHLETAILNGFDYAVVGAPLIIADGLDGSNYVDVPLKGGVLDKAYIAGDIVAANGLLALSHVKGHELTGFGGCLKNLAMGAAARRGKLDQHSSLGPKVSRQKCIGCKRCLEGCAHGAIDIVEKKASINQKKCVGCSHCISICPVHAINAQFNEGGDVFMKKLVEYAKASLVGKEKSSLFVSFITNVSPFCDCYNHSDAPIVADLGVLASHDPVALDQASADLVNQAPGLPNTHLKSAHKAGEDKWKALHPTCDWEFQLDYAEKLKMGSRKYKLTWLPEVKGVE